MDRLAREGTEYLGVEPAYPARTVVCFSSMLTGATPAEHGMRSNFAPRLGVRRESVFDVLERDGRRGRLVGIAHLLDPFGEDVVRSVTSVQPTARDRPTRSPPRRAGWSTRRTPTCSCSSCSPPTSSATCAGCAAPSTSTSSPRPTATWASFLAFLEERGKLDGRHRDPDGRPRPGPRDRRPRPPRLGRAAGAVRGLGRGRGARRDLARAALGARAGGDDLAPARRARARGRPRPRRWRAGGRAAFRARCQGAGRSPALARRGGARASRSSSRATRRPRSAAVLAGLPAEACGLPVDVLLVDDGSARRHAGHRRASTARASTRTRARAGSAPRSAPASRSPATRATPPPSTSTATASTTRPTSRACSSRSPAAAPTTCSARASSAGARA